MSSNNNNNTQGIHMKKNLTDVKMSRTLSPVIVQNNGNGVPSNTFSVLSTVSPNVNRPPIQTASTVPISATPFASARLTGLVDPNAQIVQVSTPVAVNQTVNSPVLPIKTVTVPTKLSPQPFQLLPGQQPSTILPGGSVITSAQSSVISQQTSPRINVPVQIPVSQQPIQSQQPTALIPTQGGLIQIGIPPGVASSQSVAPSQFVNQQNISPVQVNTLSGSQVQVPVTQRPASPTARSALLNLNNGSIPRQTVTIPSQAVSSIPSRVVGTKVNQESQLFPSIKVSTPNSSLPLKPTAELMNKEFEVRDYQGIISNASIENELLNAGYAPLSKIVIRTDNGDKRTQYIKAINKKGQKVFVLLDVNGYTTARSTDLTLIEAHSANIVPYSLKTGAYECAGKDVCGVAFECGSDAVCVLARGANDLTPKEANFVFVEQKAPAAAATIESEGSIMSYPVIRLSEIRANPDLVLANTDVVTRRLRNNTYAAELQELALAQQSINKLNAAFVRFEAIRENSARKLNQTLTQLEQWNNVYMANPPMTDEAKDRYRKLQYNLAQRNEGIANLLRFMKKVADKRIDIDAITKEINDISDFSEKEFANVEFAVSD